ncbi:hypothetical protein SAMN04489806_2368 [Paramicrobacterium humi]|uniref:Secreted protein n=1 Tax=Paramicrobacterium humi TaxID=640635 RepID=A0A1H4P1E2_9MICO|nr:DUF5719 family protein [Microbacterium humi]SEC01213.1 hypothetical protein SAMN04489806_2368 [Microbacterium humi]
MSSRPRIGRILRIGVGVLTVAALAGAGAAALALDLPEHDAAATPRTVTPIPADQTRVCAGPLLELGADSRAASELSSFGSALVASVASGGAGLDASALANPADATEADGATTLTLPTGDVGTAPLIGASQSQTAGQETLAGFAAAGCADTGSETWLVGGSTDVGRTTLVILNNPADVDAAVDLVVSGENGAVDAPNAHDIRVPAHSQKVVSLAGIAPNTALPVVHVVSTGADIQAWLQHSSVRGLVPSGVEMVGGTAVPSTELDIPGVAIFKNQPATTGDGYDDRRPAVRVFVPGDQPAHAEITVSDTAGKTVATLPVDVKAGLVAEFPLTDLPEGRYAVSLAATAPVAAAVRTSTDLDEKSADFAWFAAATPLEAPFLVAAAPGPSPVLAVHNPSASPVTAAIGDDEVTIDAGATHTVALKRSLEVSADAPVTAAVDYAGGSGVSSFAITPPKPASAPVDVYVR